jgi:dTDP-glucose 4,6-dehydratase
VLLQVCAAEVGHLFKAGEAMRASVAVITGGAGFLGAHLCERLLEDGYEVVCIDNFSTGRHANVAGLLDRPGFRLIHGDVNEPLRFDGRADIVLHFASPAAPRDYLNLPIETLKVGSIGTLQALALAKEQASRFLLASSSEVYGDPHVHPQTEEYWGNVNPVGPRSVYDEAKRFAESATISYRHTHRLDSSIVRIFNTFGPGMRLDDGRAVPTFVRQALRGEPISVAGDGFQTRSFCYVDDLIEGIVRLLHSDLAGPVNIGNPEEISILDLALLIKELTRSESPVKFVELPVDDPTNRRPDISLAKERLGWWPTVSLRAGLERTIEWFEEHTDALE